MHNPNASHHSIEPDGHHACSYCAHVEALVGGIVPEWAHNLELALKIARLGSSDLAHGFAELADTLESLHSEDTTRALQEESLSRLRQEVAQIIVTMQFHDRLEQILEQVTVDVARFVGEIELARHRLAAGEVTPLPDLEAWLKRLTSSYTTDEQRARAGNGQDCGDTPGITYF
ncbi:hypothetical protein [Parachitinimonas caeni]|uniref:Uncharacterized protein n=1 Tax=Parachitinimonas caeni TaxID=3031301 RepID=A0ABT7DVG5_9NEIS|nr:hypothetical protein [Parachitinimonas caeni]MDK2124056.1 hypothetical protein [Parachitinimonas caeni]